MELLCWEKFLVLGYRIGTNAIRTSGSGQLTSVEGESRVKLFSPAVGPESDVAVIGMYRYICKPYYTRP